MSFHLRRQIRDKAVDILSGIAGYAGRVHPTRMTPLDQKNLPGFCVYTMEESSQPDETGKGLFRDLTLAIEVVMAANERLDDAFDDHALAIETAMAADRTLGGICYDTLLTGSRLSLSGEGEKKTAHGVLTYQLVYRSARANPAQTNP